MSFFRDVIGLDIGSRYAKVVRAVRRGPFTVLSGAEEIALPEAEEDRNRLVRVFLEEKGLADLPCVIAMRGEDMLMRVVNTVPGDAGSERAIVEEQHEHFEDLTTGNVVSEYCVQKNPGEKNQIVFAVAREDAVRRTLDSAAEAGLGTVNLLPVPVALLNAVSWLLPSSASPLLCIDIGHAATELIIVRQRKLLFQRRFMIGASDLQDTEGVFSDTRKFDQWLEELAACISFYRSEFSAEKFTVSKAFVSSRSEFPQECAEAVSRRVGIQCAAFPLSVRAPLLTNPGRYTVAAGLALAGAGQNMLKISLLPAVLREKMVLQHQIRYWAASALLLISSVLVLVLGMASQLDNAENAFGRRSEMLERFRGMERKLEQLKDENTVLRTRLMPLTVAAWNAEAVIALLDAVTVAKDANDWIVLIADAAFYDHRPGAAQNNAPASGDGAVTVRDALLDELVIEGYTANPDLSSVQAMIEKLREDPYILSVDLLADDQVRADAGRDKSWAFAGCHLFAIEVRMVAP